MPPSARLRTPFALALTAAAATLAPAAPAAAGTMKVNACHMADGTATGTAGWTKQTAGSYVSADTDCTTALNGSFWARLNSATTHTSADVAQWSFDAPADTEIAAVAGYRSAASGTDAPYASQGYDLVADGRVLERCYEVFGCTT